MYSSDRGSSLVSPLLESCTTVLVTTRLHTADPKEKRGSVNVLERVLCSSARSGAGGVERMLDESEELFPDASGCSLES